MKIEKVDGEFIATILHSNGRFQGACVGATKEDELAEATQLLSAMVTSAEGIPQPEACHKGSALVILPPLLSAKAAIYTEVHKSGKRKADVARAVNLN